MRSTIDLPTRRALHMSSVELGECSADAAATVIEAVSYTHAMLQAFGEGIWFVDGPTVSFYGFPYPTRMAVVRLPDRTLWVWSPTEINDELGAEINRLGQVRELVAPNKLHHLFLDQWIARYPDARVYAPPGLAKRRPDLRFAAELDDTPRAEWQGAIEHVVVRGSFAMDEAVFFHVASGTALVGDLIQKHDRDAFTRWRGLVMQLDGMVGPDGSTPREWRATFLRRKQARACLDRILDWNPTRLILAHGPVFTHDAREVIASSLAWMR